jgi:hypothetical protein
MSIMKLRSSGIWVDSDTIGSVRYEGVTIPYGPDPGGPTYEAVDWGGEPTLTDALDGPTYIMGCSFSVIASKPCYGIEWRAPNSASVPPTAGAHYATLWSVSPTTQLAQVSFAPTLGAYNDILFTTPVTLTPGITYVTSILTVRYVFRAASSVGGFPISSPSGNVVVDNGRLAETGDPDVVPGGVFASIYYVSPLVGI